MYVPKILISVHSGTDIQVYFQYVQRLIAYIVLNSIPPHNAGDSSAHHHYWLTQDTCNCFVLHIIEPLYVYMSLNHIHACMQCNIMDVIPQNGAVPQRCVKQIHVVTHMCTPRLTCALKTFLREELVTRLHYFHTFQTSPHCNFMSFELLRSIGISTSICTLTFLELELSDRPPKWIPWWKNAIILT